MNKLITKSSEFFTRHWGSETQSPEWDFSWAWSGAVPNYKLGGLYALFRGDELKYIGLGNSRGGGIYQQRGISRRLEKHVLSIAPKEHPSGYVPQPRWADIGVDKVATIGFPAELSYLAPALEDYLIGELDPIENTIRRK